MMKFSKQKTSRGFDLVQFKDSYGETCDMQRSSNVIPHVWLGPHDPNPQVLVPGQGWSKHILPAGCSISHRMHLSRRQCLSLAWKLIKFGLFKKL